MKCCKKSNQRPEDEQLSIRQENFVPEPTQLEPQPQNTIVDDASENEQQHEDIFFNSPVQCWKTQLENLSGDIKLQEDSLDEDEEQFWKELIEKYLEPLQNDKEKQEKTKTDLQELRNRINFSFFFLNALWLIAIFIIQVFEVFSFQINAVDLNLNETGGKIQIEPMSLMFILGFALSVLLQFIGMLYHRVNTLIHYVAFMETEPKQQKPAKKQRDYKSNADSSSGFASVTDLSNMTEETEIETNDFWDSENEFSDLDFEEESQEH